MVELQTTEGENVTDKELDWILLRKEIDEIRVKEERDSFKSYKLNPYVIGGLAITTISYFYGVYHMNHPIKSTIGAYARISSQAVTGTLMIYWFLTTMKKKHNNISLDYHDKS